MADINAPRMRVSDHEQLVPRVLLRGLAALILTSLVIVGYASLTGRETVAQPHDRVAVAERVVVMAARDDGGTRITAADGVVLADVGPAEKGFLTVVRNALEFERRTHALTTNPPVTLIRFADGRIGLRDDVTGWKIGLIGFGQDNAKAFAELIR